MAGLPGEPLPLARPREVEAETSAARAGGPAPDWQRSDFCGTLRAADEGKVVVLDGWVQRIRDHGQLVFLDLRDRTGVVQVTCDASRTPEVHAVVRDLKPESVVAVRGRVRRRAPGAENPRMATGEIEVEPERLLVLAAAKTPPFPIGAHAPGEVDERLRLRHRYLDLRRPEMFAHLVLRHRFVKAARDFFDARGFLEIETPMLTRSTPEGARDFLVPSRLEPGSFYALPQSPQLFKQLLMVAGVERYVQFVRCFRDEDLRADRQPEHTQIDVEMSFVTQEDVLATMEAMMIHALGAVGRRPPGPFRRMSYREAIDRYGSDKPDLRFGLAIADLGPAAAGLPFPPFAKALGEGGSVRALVVPGGARLSRREIEGLAEEARERGASGLVWLAGGPDGWRGPLARPLAEAGDDAAARFLAALREGLAGPDGEAAGGLEGSLALLVAGPAEAASAALGHIRLRLAERLSLVPDGRDAFVWVTDFPMFEWNEEESRWDAKHHPFTAPHEEDLDALLTDPGRVRAHAYDLVWNGVELGSGSLRIHRRDVQERVFRAIGLGDEEAREKFGFLLEAFEYGVPPHGGMALGLDRIAMLVAGAATIREVIAFPKSASGADPLTGAPAAVDPSQLLPLGIEVRRGAPKA
ncbi:MAG: aspartate--tRNA ligase [Clostridia bacterium]|nr:aspartate--tRNA ligase [Clostridia bacterium]